MNNHTKYVKCYESHPPLTIGEHKIWGGSCCEPVVKDADVYVGFDLSMWKNHPKSYPWNEGQSFLFYIQDMGVPENLTEFKHLLDYLQFELESGRKVHIGCIGGHGRTGLVLAALVTQMTGMVDSITYVRTNYCHKAVESQRQVDWLHKHFGIATVAPTKGSYGGAGFDRGDWAVGFGSKSSRVGNSAPGVTSTRKASQSKTENLAATPAPPKKSASPREKNTAKGAPAPSIWGPNATLNVGKRNS